jgi:nucleolar complex protein 2
MFGQAVPTAATVAKSPRWKKMLPLLKTYLKALLHMMEQLTDSQMLHMLMRHAERLTPYFSTQLRLARKLLKLALNLWGSSAENRVQSLLLIRRLAVEMPYPFVEACLKGIYLTFKSASRATTPNNRLSIAFMMQARPAHPNPSSCCCCCACARARGAGGLFVGLRCSA